MRLKAVLAAVGFVGNEDDVAPLREQRELSGWTSGRNFWMVVNTTPPDCHLQQRLQMNAIFRLHRVLAQKFLTRREHPEQLVVEIVAVGQHN